MTGTGGAGTTSHNAMVNGQGFGTTIRAINSIECNGGNPAQMQRRGNLYKQVVGGLGVTAGGKLSCWRRGDRPPLGGGSSGPNGRGGVPRRPSPPTRRP